jgi:hypothetical protein
LVSYFAEFGNESQNGPEIDADLARVLNAWPTLLKAIRAGILAVVEAAKTEKVRRPCPTLILTAPAPTSASTVGFAVLGIHVQPRVQPLCLLSFDLKRLATLLPLSKTKCKPSSTIPTPARSKRRVASATWPPSASRQSNVAT